jgi:hypothetical protein
VSAKHARSKPAKSKAVREPFVVGAKVTAGSLNVLG